MDRSLSQTDFDYLSNTVINVSAVVACICWYLATLVVSFTKQVILKTSFYARNAVALISLFPELRGHDGSWLHIVFFRHNNVYFNRMLELSTTIIQRFFSIET